MIYTEMTKKALKLTYEVHKDQVDKSGMPYVFHPFHLAEQMEDEISTVVALLHDVVEDSKYTLADLVERGFSEPVIKSLDLLTHRSSDSYMEYIEKLSIDPVARKVKLADLEHNSDLSRLDKLTEKDRNRVEKYRKANLFLKNIDGGKNG